MSETRQMQSLIWLGPATMEMRSTAIPELQDDEVLIEVSAAGICGSELSGYLGQNSLRKPPLIMGHEAAGTIVQVAGGTLADGSPARPGTRVTFNPLLSCGACDRCRANLPQLCRKRVLVGAHRPGAFAQFVAVPAQQCYALPDGLTESAGALTEPLACAVHAISLAQIQTEHNLLILGAGPIGLFCLAAARAMGIKRVLITDISPTRLAIAEKWGASRTINARNQDVQEELTELLPNGADAVIDAVGTHMTREQAVKAVVPGGQVIFIGLHNEESPLAANYLVRQEITIKGSFAYTPRDFQQAFHFLTRGHLRIDSSWLQERPLAEGAGAFAELVAGTAPVTKIVLRVG